MRWWYVDDGDHDDRDSIDVSGDDDYNEMMIMHTPYLDKYYKKIIMIILMYDKL